jgi:hypothetical protein
VEASLQIFAVVTVMSKVLCNFGELYRLLPQDRSPNEQAANMTVKMRATCSSATSGLLRNKERQIPGATIFLKLETIPEETF